MLRLRVRLYDIQSSLGKVVFGRRNPPIASLVFHILLLLTLGPVAYVAGVILISKRFLWQHLVLYGTALAYLLLVVPRSVADILPRDTRSLFAYWLLLVPLSPLAGLAMLGWNKISGVFGKRTIEVEREEQEQRRLEIEKRRAQHAMLKTQVQPGSSRGYLNVGVKIEGEEFPSHIGIEEQDDWVRLNYPLLFHHVLVLGTTGAGKTDLLLRIISEAWRNTGLRIYVIDGKGDLEFAAKVAALAYRNGRGRAPIFMMGQSSHRRSNASLYDGFRGDRDAIANRLAAMMSLDKTVGNAQHYSDTYKSLIHLICGVGHPELGIAPPRNFDEVLDRLTFSWLAQTYAEVPRELEFIKMAREGRENLVASAWNRLASLARSLEGVVSSSGFSLETTRCAIFSLRTQSVGVDAKKFLDFLIEDVKDWIGKRQPPGVEALLIIDEFGSFDNESITDVLALARSSRVGVILATHDVATLGDDRMKRQILANCNTYFLMKTNFPEELVQLAGTIYEVEPSYQLEHGEPTGMQSARIQHQFKIRPNDVARVTPGQCYIINSRYAVKMHVARIGNIQVDNDAIASNFVKKEARPEEPKTSAMSSGYDDVPDIPD